MPGEPGTRWGWHELDRSWARRLVAAAEISPGDLVLDVGAGEGSVTEALIASGARVIAVELHPARTAILRQQFSGQNVVVVAADASDLRLPRRPFKVVANRPFGITTALIKRIVAKGSRLVRANLVVPRHVARRWCSDRAPGRGRWSELYVASVGQSIPRSAFRPAPPNDVVVLVIELRARRGLGR